MRACREHDDTVGISAKGNIHRVLSQLTMYARNPGICFQIKQAEGAQQPVCAGGGQG